MVFTKSAEKTDSSDSGWGLGPGETRRCPSSLAQGLTPLRSASGRSAYPPAATVRRRRLALCSAPAGRAASPGGPRGCRLRTRHFPGRTGRAPRGEDTGRGAGGPGAVVRRRGEGGADGGRAEGGVAGPCPGLTRGAHLLAPLRAPPAFKRSFITAVSGTKASPGVLSSGPCPGSGEQCGGDPENGRFRGRSPAEGAPARPREARGGGSGASSASSGWLAASRTQAWAPALPGQVTLPSP